MSPLLYCSAVYDEDLAVLCTPYGNLDAPSPGGGYTALHFAGAGNMPLLAAALLEHRADPNARSSVSDVPI